VLTKDTGRIGFKGTDQAGHLIDFIKMVHG
jgi:hypothetical protein